MSPRIAGPGQVRCSGHRIPGKYLSIPKRRLGSPGTQPTGQSGIKRQQFRPNSPLPLRWQAGRFERPANRSEGERQARFPAAQTHMRHRAAHLPVPMSPGAGNRTARRPINGATAASGSRMAGNPTAAAAICRSPILFSGGQRRIPDRNDK